MNLKPKQIKAIKDSISKLLKSYVGLPKTNKTFERLFNECAQIMYNNGFNDDWNSKKFKSVSSANLQIYYDHETRVLTVKFFDDKDWQTITLRQLKYVLK